MAESVTMRTAAQANDDYARLCSQIGQLALERDALYDRLDEIAAKVRDLKVAVAKMAGQHDALAANEAALAAALALVPPSDGGKAPLTVVKGDADAD